MGQGSRNTGHCGLTWERMCSIVKLKILGLKAMERRDHFESKVSEKSHLVQYHKSKQKKETERKTEGKVGEKDDQENELFTKISEGHDRIRAQENW